MTHASVFSGIGGPEVAAAMLGWENLFHCEINPFGRAVLEYWFPNSKSYEDITTTDFSEWGGKVNVLTGGFPCQPFSYAGQRRGADDDRYLWPFMHRCINQVRPDWVVCENVGGILTMVEQGDVTQVAAEKSLFDEGDTLYRYRLDETFTLERICNDLENDGYAVQAVIIPACAVGAPHRRDRVFIVARRIEAVSEDSMHSRQLYGQDEVEGSERNIGDVGAGGGERICSGTSGTNDVADTEHLRLQHDSGRGEQAADIGTQSGRGQDVLSESIQCAETVGKGGTTTDTTGECSQRMRPEQSETRGTSQEQSGGRGGEGGSQRQTSDGQGRIFQREVSGLGISWDAWGRGDGEYQVGERWQDFPTVSPVHRGNDGLPFPLDDLSISPSKWRTESLKAYGNAIVPQVMYEIFRAIEETYK